MPFKAMSYKKGLGLLGHEADGQCRIRLTDRGISYYTTCLGTGLWVFVRGLKLSPPSSVQIRHATKQRTRPPLPKISVEASPHDCEHEQGQRVRLGVVPGQFDAKYPEETSPDHNSDDK